MDERPANLPATLGELRASGWVSRPVKAEIRANAIARMRAGEPLFAGIIGYDETVLPQVENALLAGHDMVFLGERGQAKTRIVRGLVELLDEWLPVVAGSEINDDPDAPVSRYARDLVAEHGDATPIAWVHRQQRYGEKLATPDTSIADLIGEVDPIKVAEGRYLSDELTVHYGLVPRHHRGIFAVNELPDLAERIQVGLLNVLEERDVQIRGYSVRLPLDVLLGAAANTEDYTNRGRMITPLKDRFGSQIRTHYPLDVDTELAIMAQEVATDAALAGIDGADDVDGVAVRVPDYLRTVVATLSQLARSSPHVNQRSGVSVRMSVSNLEAVAANAVRRALRAGEDVAVARVEDLAAMAASAGGKLEIESFDDGGSAAVFDDLVRAAVLTVFRQVSHTEHWAAAIDAFEHGVVAETGETVTSRSLAALAAEVPAIGAVVGDLIEPSADEADIAAAVSFALEGLHLSKRLNKDATAAPGGARYRRRA